MQRSQATDQQSAFTSHPGRGALGFCGAPSGPGMTGQGMAEGVGP